MTCVPCSRPETGSRLLPTSPVRTSGHSKTSKGLHSSHRQQQPEGPLAMPGHCYASRFKITYIVSIINLHQFISTSINLNRDDPNLLGIGHPRPLDSASSRLRPPLSRLRSSDGIRCMSVYITINCI